MMKICQHAQNSQELESFGVTETNKQSFYHRDDLWLPHLSHASARSQTIRTIRLEGLGNKDGLLKRELITMMTHHNDNREGHNNSPLQNILVSSNDFSGRDCEEIFGGFRQLPKPLRLDLSYSGFDDGTFNRIIQLTYHDKKKLRLTAYNARVTPEAMKLFQLTLKESYSGTIFEIGDYEEEYIPWDLYREVETIGEDNQAANDKIGQYTDSETAVDLTAVQWLEVYKLYMHKQDYLHQISLAHPDVVTLFNGNGNRGDGENGDHDMQDDRAV